MARPLIALLTDFGLRDHYAGTMKGVALGICPEATFVDISHDVPAHDVLAGALELAESYRYFPGGTIFLVVVDPGVGTARRGIAVEAGDYRFVGPDNGVLSLALKDAPVRKAVELTDRRYARPTISRTFEGRDRFAPAAAWLARGIALTALGRPAGPLAVLDVPEAQVGKEGDVAGEVLRVDRFGNLVTNISRVLLDRVPPPASVELGGRTVSLVSTYGDAARGALCALVGSSDHLEVAMNGGNAAESLGLGRGAPVRVRRTA